MYGPLRYKNNTSDFIFNFIQKYPFATVIIQGSYLLATHVPILVDGTAKKFQLYGHIANHNPMREFLVDNQEMLLVFNGPDSYISSSWYLEPDIPTWDYTAVHINATVQVQTAGELQTSLEKLILQFEKGLKNTISPKDIPSHIWEENFKDITGFWLKPFKLTGIEKLHQGFKKEDVKNIVRQLESDPKCPYGIVDVLIKKHGISN